MSLTLQQSDIFLATLLHSKEKGPPRPQARFPPDHESWSCLSSCSYSCACSLRRRRTVSTSFEQPRILKKTFQEERRTRSFDQNVSRLPETLIRKQETFTSISEEEEKEEHQEWWRCSWKRLERLPGLGVILIIITVLIYQVVFCFFFISCPLVRERDHQRNDCSSLRHPLLQGLSSNYRSLLWILFTCIFPFPPVRATYHIRQENSISQGQALAVNSQVCNLLHPSPEGGLSPKI